MLEVLYDQTILALKSDDCTQQLLRDLGAISAEFDGTLRHDYVAWAISRNTVYTQCIELPRHSLQQEKNIVKLNVSMNLERYKHFSGQEAEDSERIELERPLLDDSATGDITSKIPKVDVYKIFRKKFDDGMHGLGRITQKLGFWAPRIELPLLAIGSGRPPVHVRILAPQGTVIDWIEILDDAKKVKYAPFRSSEKILIDRLHDRAVLLDRGIPRANYKASIKLNPKRAFFLWPAFGATVALATILTIAIFAGKAGLEKGDLATALFVVPSLMALFLVRETEHEIVTRMLSWQRRFLASIALATYGIGGIYSIRNETAIPLYLLLLMLFLVVGAAFLGGLLFLFQIGRIAKMRPCNSRKSSIRAAKEYIISWFVLLAVFSVTAVCWHDNVVSYILRIWGL